MLHYKPNVSSHSRTEDICAGVRRNIRLIVKHTEQLTTYAISVVVSIVVFANVLEYKVMEFV